jgi:phage terminase large subunit
MLSARCRATDSLAGTICLSSTVKACHASGKSYPIAIAVLWWLTAHRDGIVVTTAPTWLQVEKVMWGEIKSAVRRSVLCGKLKFPVPTQTELRLGPQNYAIGLSTDDSSAFKASVRVTF